MFCKIISVITNILLHLAKIKIHTIQFLQNYEEYSLGDIIDVFVETDDVTLGGFTNSDGVTCELNGSPLLSGSFLPLIGSNVISVNQLYQQFCSSTNLVLPSYFIVFPYGVYSTLPNHYSCAINSPTCDLIVIGTPTITPASGELVADGIIIVNAQSSNPIQYALADFVYGDGQASNIFVVIPGTYRIFLRDSANCGANLLVTVGFTNEFGVYYRYEYDDIAGRETRVDILKRGYVGDLSIIKGGRNAIEISLRGGGSVDKFEPVLSTNTDLNLVSEQDEYFTELYTNDRNLYQMRYYKEGVLKWVGKILPFSYMDELKHPPYYLNVKATDGIPYLDEYYLIQQDGQKFYGTVSLVKLIAYCLSKTGIELNIRVGVNLYAEDMDQDDEDDPLDQAYCDYELFYLATQEPTLDFVLRNILKTFKARLIQWDGVWNIVRVEELSTIYDYREFDKNGDYLSHSTFNPIKDVEYPDQNGLMFTGFPSREITPGYGQVKTFYKLGLKPNIIDNGDFRLKSTFVPSFNTYTFEVNTDKFTLVNAGYPLTQGYEKIDDGNIAYWISGGEEMLFNTSSGDAYLQSNTYNVAMGVNNTLKILLRYKINRSTVTFAGNSYSVENPYVKLRFRVKWDNYYLQADGSWTTNVNVIEVFVTTYNEYQETEIVAQSPPDGNLGGDLDIRVYHAYAFWAKYQSIASLKAVQTIDGVITDPDDIVIPTGYRTELRDDFTAPSYIHYYELQETTEAENGYLIIRPTDYHSTTNPRQWVRVNVTYVGAPVGANVFTLFLDRIKVTYLLDGKEPPDTIIRAAKAEPLNNAILEDEIIMGSESSLIVSETNFSIDLGAFFPNAEPGITITTVNVLSSRLIYTGWLRDSAGNGFEFWARDAFSERELLHVINNRQLASQYYKSWQLLRASIISKTDYFGFLNTLRNPNASDILYIPISGRIKDRDCIFDGEFLELIDATSGGISGFGFTKGFTTGFNA